MDTCTDVSTRGTGLLSRAGLATADASLRPRVAPLARLRTIEPGLAGWRGQQETCPTAGTAGGAFQGGAMAMSGQAPVIDRTVTDHQYSTRPGLSSCSPPV